MAQIATNNYMEKLLYLDDEEKLDIIAMLTASLKKCFAVSKEKEDANFFDCFHGDWGGEQSPEEYASDLRSERHFDRTLEEW